MLERPYRIIPNDIVLIQNRPYRLIIQAGEEWHQFAADVLSQDVLLPPGGEAEILEQPQQLGVFPIYNNRRIQESLLLNTITVVPEGIEPSTWNRFCVEFTVAISSARCWPEHAVYHRGYSWTCHAAANHTGTKWAASLCLSY